MPLRSAFYVDGFNLYHAIDALHKPHLKWLDLRKLSHRLLLDRSNEQLTLVRYFSAVKKTNPAKAAKHREYISALQHEQVSVILGRFTAKETECRNCSHVWMADNEKETDVNLALNVVVDAFKDLFDRAYIITADSDQAATFAMMRSLFPNKEMVTVSPPGMELSKSILTFASHKVRLNEAMVAQCLLPKERFHLSPTEARLLYRRPLDYDPPQV